LLVAGEKKCGEIPAQSLCDIVVASPFYFMVKNERKSKNFAEKPQTMKNNFQENALEPPVFAKRTRSWHLLLCAGFQQKIHSSLSFSHVPDFVDN